MIYPFDPWEILYVTGIAHRYERHLNDVADPPAGLAFRALEPTFSDQRNFAHHSAARAIMPLRESEKWDGQVTIGRGIVPPYPTVVWR